MDHSLKLGRLGCLLMVAKLVILGLQTQGSQRSVSEEISSEDVKRFLAPTVMNSVLEYPFQANFLPQKVRLYSHRPYIGWPLKHWSAVWAEVPFWDFSTPGVQAPSGISDALIG